MCRSDTPRLPYAALLLTKQEVGPQLERRVGSRSAPRGSWQTIRLLEVLTVGRPAELAATHFS
jgi:hypothetical protein